MCDRQGRNIPAWAELVSLDWYHTNINGEFPKWKCVGRVT